MKRHGVPLNTYGFGSKGRREPEYNKLNVLIAEVRNAFEGMESEADAERLVAYAWALYVFADEPLYNLNAESGKKMTKFPFSSFIEVAQGYLLAAFDQKRYIESKKNRPGAEQAYWEAIGRQVKTA
jgi:hypothetical protein